MPPSYKLYSSKSRSGFKTGSQSALRKLWLAGDRPLPEDLNSTDGPESLADNGARTAATQLQLFEYPGPLFSVVISPASSVIQVGKQKNFLALARDRSRRLRETGVSYRWDIKEGSGEIKGGDGEIATFFAPPEPGLTRLHVTACQGDIVCHADALITVTDSLITDKSRLGEDETKRGIPAYTFQNAPGELWRSRYQLDQNVVVVNSGHRDFIYASRSKALKLRYICRLFSKELVLMNFVGLPPADVLERFIELSLYVEENLR